MTTEYNVGDLVEITKGDVVIRDRLAESDHLPGRLFLPNHYEQVYVDSLPAGGWSVTVIEKAAPKNVLPTEAGYYHDRDGDVWRARVNDHGDLEWFLGLSFVAAARAIQSAPFTRLEPVPFTAKNVLDRMRTLWNEEATGYPDIEDLDRVAKEFGIDQ